MVCDCKPASKADAIVQRALSKMPETASWRDKAIVARAALVQAFPSQQVHVTLGRNGFAFSVEAAASKETQ